MSSPPVDLTKAPPRSPRVRLGGYAILARTLDKCRASISHRVGSYHFNCPLDERFFQFAGVSAADFRRKVEAGATDDEMVAWLGEAGARRAAFEIEGWSDQAEAERPERDGDRRDWFIQQCRPLGLDPIQTTLFDWLEADDRTTFARVIG